MGIEPTSEAWETGNKTIKVEVRMRPKPRLTLAFFLFAALQRQLNQRDFGGGVWKSNECPISKSLTVRKLLFLMKF
jgi:hypothetical protein